MLAALALVGALGLAACGDDDAAGDTPTPTPEAAETSGVGGSEESAVEAAVRTIIEAQDGGDVDTFLRHWTDQALLAEFQRTREELQQLGPDEFRVEGEVRGISALTVSGDAATAEAEFTLAQAVHLGRFSLIREDAVWKVDGVERLSPDVPEGVTAVDVEMQEFAFVFLVPAEAGGALAFSAHNSGQQPHELVLARLGEDVDLQQALMGEQPEGVDFVAYVPPLDPGERRNMVFTGALDAGRYAMACFVPDTTDRDQAPHAFKGMVAEFRIE